MKKLLTALALLLASALHAHAQTASFYLLKDASSPQSSFNMLLWNNGSGKSSPVSVSSDANGSPLSGTIGTTNPNGTALFVQGATGGVPVLTAFSAPQHVVCDSGCSSGGGGAVNITQILGAAPSATNPLWIQPGTGASFGVTGTFWQATQPISAASLPLPTGAATQSTLASVLSALGSPMQTTGGSVTANAGTNLNTSGLAIETGGNLANIYAAIGNSVSPAANTLQARLVTLNTTLGSPFQSGGSIGNTSFGISGTLPAFAATPTVNLGTLNGAATAANQTSVTGTVVGGTAATNSLLAGGVYNSTPITVTNAQQAALQIDANGFLKVNVVLGGGGSATFGASFPSTGVALGMTQGGLLTAITGTSGNLNVQCANCSGSGVSTADQAAFTAGASLFAGGGGFYQTTATSNALTNGQQGMWQLTANRAGFVNLRNAAGTEIGTSSNPVQVTLANTGSNATAVKVDGSGVTQPVSGTVTANSGTNLNTSLLALETGGNLATLAGAVTSSKLQDNIAQINGVTPLMGNGVTGTGSQRVTIASDNTAFSVNATLSAETTKVIGTVNQGTSPWVISGTVTANAGTNLNTSALALETGGNLATIVTNTGHIPAQGQALAAASLPVVLTAAQIITLTPPAAITGFALDTSVGTTNTDIGPPGATACATDTGSCSINALAQRLAQRLTTINTTLNSPFQAGGSIGNTSFAATQVTAANLNATVVGTGTFATQSAVTAASGAFSSGSLASGAMVDLIASQTPVAPATATATKGLLAGGTYTSTQPTLTTTQQAALAFTSRNAVIVAPGADNFAVQATLSAETTKVIGTVNQGTSPWVISGAVTGTFYQATQPVSIASGQVASGAVASGAYASGSLASGAMVDLTNLSTPISPTTATATKGILLGTQYNSTQATFTNGQQGTLQSTSRGALMVGTGADTFNVTVNAALPAGTNLMGKVGIDQTTVGTTNGVSLAQIGSTTVSTGTGAQGAGAQRVTVATDTATVAGSASIPAGTNLMGKVGIDQTTPGTTNAVQANVASGGIASGAVASGAIASGAVASGAIASGAFAAGSFLNATAADPCMFQAKTNLAISQNGTSSVQLVALSGSTSIYVCSISLVAAGATTVAITTGTGTACVTGNAAVIGSTTANIANSMSFAANGGMTMGNGGGTVAKGASSSELCMVLGTSVYVSGNLTYVQQ